MRTWWLTGERPIEPPHKSDDNAINQDEGIDDIDEITFTFHVSEPALQHETVGGEDSHNI